MIYLFSRGGAARPVLAAARGQVCFTSNNRLNSAGLHGLVKGNSAVHVTVIGHGTGFHAQRFGAFGERFYLDGAVEKAVVSVEMKMYEVLVLHDECVLRNQTVARWKSARVHTISRGVGESTRQHLDVSFYLRS